MSTLVFTKQTTPASPTSGKVRIFIDDADGYLKSIDSVGVVTTYGALTPEQIQDIVGAMMIDTSTVNVTYNDIGNVISFDVIQTALDHTNFLNIGTNSHAAIDSHIASTSNPHSVTKTQVGLSNVPNVDATNSANITQDSAHRFATDTEKATWNAKEPAITATTSADYYRGDKTFQPLNKAAVGLGNVDNTSDLNKPISTATQTALNTKVTGNTAITPGTNTKITYDEKGLVTAGSQAALNDLSDVLLTSPAVDQVMKYNGSKWVNGSAAQTNAGAGVDLFLSATASGISVYDLMSRTPDGAAEVDESITITNTTSFFEGYIQDVALSDTTIDPGIWTFQMYLYADHLRPGHTTSIYIEVYKRSSGGTETLLFTTAVTPIVSKSVELYPIYSAQSAFSCSATDKLLFKIYATTNDSLSETVHLVHSGNVHYSHVNTPLVVHHNNLAGLQGGAADEYYHLTAAEYTGSGSGTFVRSSSPHITTPTGIVKGDVGLSNVPNVDATNPANITQDSTHRFVSDSEKSTWNGKQDAVIGAATTITSSNLTASKALVSDTGGKVAVSSTSATEVGYLSGVTSAIQTQLGSKEPTITATTSADYYRGDKTFQPLNKAAVGLSNVDNTADTAKAIAGDVTGTLGTSTVTKIRGSAVSTTAPQDGETLVWNAETSQYVPQGPVTATTVNTVSNTNTALTVASNYYQIWIGTTPGQRITLPDATTLALGDDYFLVNNSSTIIPVYNNTGVLQGIIYPQQYGEFMLTANGTAAGSWFNEIAFPNYNQQSPLFDEFISSGTTSGAIGNLGWTLVTGAGHTVTYANSATTDLGVLNMGTGTGILAGYAIHLGNTHIVPGGGAVVVEWRVRFPTLATAGQDYGCYIGLNNAITATSEPTNAIYFAYVRGTSANWIAKTANGGTRTTVTSSIAVAVNTWYKLTLVVNAAGTQVDFYIDGAFIGSSTTNITAATLGPQHNTQKIAGATDITNNIDYFYMTKTFTVNR